MRKLLESSSALMEDAPGLNRNSAASMSRGPGGCGPTTGARDNRADMKSWPVPLTREEDYSRSSAIRQSSHRTLTTGVTGGGGRVVERKFFQAALCLFRSPPRRVERSTGSRCPQYLIKLEQAPISGAKSMHRHERDNTSQQPRVVARPGAPTRKSRLGGRFNSA